jgi:hypothetical protein
MPSQEKEEKDYDGGCQMSTNASGTLMNKIMRTKITFWFKLMTYRVYIERDCSVMKEKGTKNFFKIYYAHYEPLLYSFTLANRKNATW